jgi:hypothetical protein
MATNGGPLASSDEPSIASDGCRDFCRDLLQESYDNDGATSSDAPRDTVDKFWRPCRNEQAGPPFLQ